MLFGRVLCVCSLQAHLMEWNRRTRKLEPLSTPRHNRSRRLDSLLRAEDEDGVDTVAPKTANESVEEILI